MEQMSCQPHGTSLRVGALTHRRLLSISEHPDHFLDSVASVPRANATSNDFDLTRVRSLSLPRSRAGSASPSPNRRAEAPPPQRQTLSERHLSSVTALVGDLQRILNPSLWITDQMLHQHYESKKEALEDFLQQRKNEMDVASQKAIEEAKSQFTDQTNYTAGLVRQVAELKSQLNTEREAKLKVHESSRLASMHSNAVIGQLEARIVALEDMYIESQRRLQGYEQALLFHCTESSDEEDNRKNKMNSPSPIASGASALEASRTQLLSPPSMPSPTDDEPKLTASLLATHNQTGRSVNEPASGPTINALENSQLGATASRAFDPLQFVKNKQKNGHNRQGAYNVPPPLNAKAIAASLAIDEAMRKFVCLDDQKIGAIQRRERSHTKTVTLQMEVKNMRRIVIEKEAMIESLEGQVQELRADMSRLAKGGGYSIATRSVAAASVRSGGSTRHKQHQATPPTSPAAASASATAADLSTSSYRPTDSNPQSPQVPPKRAEIEGSVAPGFGGAKSASYSQQAPRAPKGKKSTAGVWSSLGSRIKSSVTAANTTTMGNVETKTSPGVVAAIPRPPTAPKLIFPTHLIVDVEKESTQPPKPEQRSPVLSHSGPSVQFQLPTATIVTNETADESVKPPTLEKKLSKSASGLRPSSSKSDLKLSVATTATQGLATMGSASNSQVHLGESIEMSSVRRNEVKNEAVLRIVEIVDRLVFATDAQLENKKNYLVKRKESPNRTQKERLKTDVLEDTTDSKKAKGALQKGKAELEPSTSFENSAVEGEGSYSVSGMEDHPGLFKVVANLYLQIQRQQQIIDKYQKSQQQQQ